MIPSFGTSRPASSVLQLGLPSTDGRRTTPGNWTDKPNFFDVKVSGNQAEMLSQHLTKGRRIGIDGRLDWSSWEAQDGSKRSKVEVVAASVQFLDSRADGEAAASASSCPPTRAQAPAPGADFGQGADDDIPF